MVSATIIFPFLFFLLLALLVSGEESEKCRECRKVVAELVHLHRSGNQPQQLLEVARTVLCSKELADFKERPFSFCRAAGDPKYKEAWYFESTFNYIVPRLVADHSEHICARIRADCEPFDFDPFNIAWKDDRLAEILAGSPSKSRGKKPLRFLQIADIHMDAEYEPGTEAKCKDRLCCPGSSSAVESSPKKIEVPAGYWGTMCDGCRCDVPRRTVHHLFQHLGTKYRRARDHVDLDFVILSGDNTSHRRQGLTDEAKRRQVEMFDEILTLFNKHLPGVPLFWTLGNYEALPVGHYAPRSTVHDRSLWPSWLYDTFLKVLLKSHTLPLEPAAKKSAKFRGSYSVLVGKPDSKLRLISLNTGYSDTGNFFLPLGQQDPDGTMTWFVGELEKAEKNGEKVYISGHQPTGSTGTYQSWAQTYCRVVRRFEDTIMGQFYGDVHVDLFRLFYEDMNDHRSRPIGVQFASPSVSSFTEMNPAYRVWTADPVSFRLLDYETWSMDLGDVRNVPQKCPAPKWQLLYRAREAYGLKDMSPDSWNRLLGRIQNEKEMTMLFYKHMFRRMDDPNIETKFLPNVLKDVCRMRMSHQNKAALCPELIELEEQKRRQKKEEEEAAKKNEASTSGQ